MTAEQVKHFIELDQKYFDDVVYALLMTIKADFEEITPQYENQSGHVIKPIGIRRLRALELLNIEINSAKKSGIGGINMESKTMMRRQVIDTMLSVLETYAFCSVACQQVLQVLECIYDTPNPDELNVLKKFVYTIITRGQSMEFESGRLTTSMVFGSSIKLALCLKKLSLPLWEGIDPRDILESSMEKRWRLFC